MKNVIAPSILAADFARLGEEIDKVIAAGADWIHVDVMDNHFVPNLTMGPQIVKSIVDYGVNVPLDVHLMIKPVEDMIKPFAEAGADYITFHVDAVDDIEATIKLIRDNNCKPGVVFNPEVPLGNLEDYIDDVEMVLIMSVNAGFGGQAFMPEVLEKVQQVRKMIDATGTRIRLQIDGGINVSTIHQAAEAGADTFVVGSAIFKSKDYAKTIGALKRASGD
jgi:ribulose-phosphate 3-epimerase